MKELKNRASSLVKKSQEKKKAKTYDEFCKTKLAKKSKLAEEEIAYYTSTKKEEK